MSPFTSRAASSTAVIAAALLVFAAAGPPSLAQVCPPSFDAARSYTVGFGPDSIAVADLNRDGLVDIAIGTDNYNNSISILLGRPDGKFQRASDADGGGYEVGWQLRSRSWPTARGNGASAWVPGSSRWAATSRS